MKTSSVRQLELDISVPDRNDKNATQQMGAISGGMGSAASTPVNFPNFNGPPQVYAATSRIAGRLNAANISQEEQDALLTERAELLDKKFDGAITKKESIRLEYVRWSLDRIEDAKYGQALDALDDSVRKYEQFLEQIKSLKQQLDDLAPSGDDGKRNKKRY